MDKHLIILALALVLASTVALSLFWYAAAATAALQPQFKEPPVSCALPEPQFAEYSCTVRQTMPSSHPAEGAADVRPVFLPLYPGSSICRAYYVDGLANGTLIFCPVQDLDRHN